MQSDFFIIYAFLLGYLITYLLFHLPFDITMLIKKKDVKYPSPPFENFLQGFLVVVPSIILWFIITIAPILSLISQINLILFDYDDIILPIVPLLIRFVGALILSIGLIVECLGRISRGTYLANEKPILSTTLGHAIVRHPSYFLYITGFIGLPLITLNPYLLLLLFGIKGYVSLTDSEEKALIEYFGTSYEIYMLKVGKLFPKIKKNKQKKNH